LLPAQNEAANRTLLANHERVGGFAPRQQLAVAVPIGGAIFPVEKVDLVLDGQKEDEFCKAGFAVGENIGR
jgi:hypothetical protein